MEGWRDRERWKGDRDGVIERWRDKERWRDRVMEG